MTSNGQQINALQQRIEHLEAELALLTRGAEAAYLCLRDTKPTRAEELLKKALKKD